MKWVLMQGLQVQDIVIGNKGFMEATKPNEIVSLLLNDDELAMANLSKDSGDASKENVDLSSAPLRDLWTDEGDEFFGQTKNAAAVAAAMDDEEPAQPAAVPEKKKRGRPPSGKHHKKKQAGTGDALPEDL
jgi:DNA helicase INO80